MKKMILAMVSIVLFTNISMAGHSGFVDVGKVVISTVGVEVEDNNQTPDGCSRDSQWNLDISHPNYDALVSSLLLAKASGKKLDFILDASGSCLDPIITQIELQ